MHTEMEGRRRLRHWRIREANDRGEGGKEGAKRGEGEGDRRRAKDKGRTKFIAFYQNRHVILILVEILNKFKTSNNKIAGKEL